MFVVIVERGVVNHYYNSNDSLLREIVVSIDRDGVGVVKILVVLLLLLLLFMWY